MTNQQQPVIIQMQPAPSNGLGIAGFVISLVGLVTCGVLCPLGALLSFIALFKRPRGFAIAGFVIGMAGMLVDLLVFLIYGVAVFAFCTSLGAGLPDAITRGQMQAGSQRIVQYRVTHAGYPDDLSGQMLVDPFRDGWGHSMQYHRSPAGDDYEIRSAGPDGVFGTADDRTRSALGAAPIPGR